MTPLTIEEQRDLMRRLEEGCRFGKELQAREARARSDAENWDVADRLLTGLDVARAAELAEVFDPRTGDGQVLAQQRFMRIRALQQAGGAGS